MKISWGRYRRCHGFKVRQGLAMAQSYTCRRAYLATCPIPFEPMPLEGVGGGEVLSRGWGSGKRSPVEGESFFQLIHAGQSLKLSQELVLSRRSLGVQLSGSNPASSAR